MSFLITEHYEKNNTDLKQKYLKNRKDVFGKLYKRCINLSDDGKQEDDNNQMAIDTYDNNQMAIDTYDNNQMDVDTPDNNTFPW